MNHICVQCGTMFITRRSISRYCAAACYHEAQRTRPNAGTFKPGAKPKNWEPVGSVVIRRRHTRTDGPRAWVKVAEPNVWTPRATLIWQAYNGPVPLGHVVHHINRDTLDDSPANLVLITRAEHLAEHRPEFEEYRSTRATQARWGTA